MDSTALRQAQVTAPSAHRPAPEPVPARPSADGGTHLRLEVQALRAVAVSLVVGYHLWPKAIPAGFIGVDVFFVISGFLITSLLLRELDGSGRISLTNFWARRARRILPAALVVIGATFAATAIFVPVNLWTQYLGDLRASTFYVQNWHLAHAAVDYFAAEQSPSPVQHYWSLAVEEQFYLVWPLLLLGAALLTRRAPRAARRRFLLVAIGTATTASLVYGILHTKANPADAYFATTTRAWQLGAGALLALAPTVRAPVWARTVLSLAGLAAIGVAAGAFTKNTPFPGTAALLPVLGAVAVIYAGAPRGRLTPTPVLGWAPVQFVGGISYSAYLWHWPLLILAPYVLHHAVDTPTRITVLMLTLLIAWLSRALLEDPIRRSKAIARRGAAPTFAVAAAATVAVIVATGAGAAHVDAQIRQDELATKKTLASHPKCFGAVARDPDRTCKNPKLRTTVVPTPVQAPKMDNSPCELVEKRGRIRACAFGADPASAQSTFALIGDSHASHWRSGLNVLAKDKTWRGLSVTHTSCPFSAAMPVIDEPARSECQEWKQQTLQWLAGHPEITTVFLGQHAGGSIVHKPNIDLFTAQMNGYTKIWKQFPESVKRVFIIRDTPKMHSDTLDCIQNAITAHKNAGTACAVPVGQALEDRDPAAVAVSRRHPPRVKTIDINRLLCSPRVCFPVIGGALVYKDIHHLTTVFSASLGPYVERQVDDYLRAEAK